MVVAGRLIDEGEVAIMMVEAEATATSSRSSTAA